MNKKFLMMFLSVSTALTMGACGNKEANVEPKVDNQVAEESQMEDAGESSEATTELTEDERNEVFKSYTDGLTKLADKTFDMKVGYKANDGLYSEIDSPSGTLYWNYLLNTTNLITADYDGTNNTLTFNSLDVNNDKQTEVASSVKLNDFIDISDDTKILFSGFDTTAGQTMIMVESRGLAYTYADGVNYRLVLIEVSDDGTLNTVFDKQLAGSGDEDITADIRSGFNAASGKNYDQATFEDAFYNNNLLIEQENMPVSASISFKSDAAKLADAGDWDSASAISATLWEDYEKDKDPINWGQGKFTAESYK